jgi:hypothetical protein
MPARAKRAALLTAALLALPARAAELPGPESALPSSGSGAVPGAPLRGVWRGTLGGQAIIVCFNGGDAERRTGSWYPLARPRPVALRAAPGLGALEEVGAEGRADAIWELGAVDGDALQGARTPAGGEPAPIRLSRLSGGGDDRACAGDDFNAPLERPALETGPVERFERGRFRRLRFGPEETVELVGDGPALEKIDAELRKELPRGPEDLEEAFSIRRAALGRSGTAEEDEVRAEPVYWTSQLVTVLVTRRIASEGADGVARTLRTWDLASGERVNLWSWFAGAGKSAPDTDTGPLPAEVRAFLATQAGAGASAFAGCELEAALDEPWEVGLEPAGLRFTLAAYPRTVCEPSILVPWARLGPILSPAGEAAVSRIAGRRRDEAPPRRVPRKPPFRQPSHLGGAARRDPAPGVGEQSKAGAFGARGSAAGAGRHAP